MKLSKDCVVRKKKTGQFSLFWAFVLMVELAQSLSSPKPSIIIIFIHIYLSKLKTDLASLFLIHLHISKNIIYLVKNSCELF